MDWNMARDHSHARRGHPPVHIFAMAMIMPARTNATIRAWTMSQKRGTGRLG
jgi:hypothetical protein